jgi:formylglycine-generating enzyme required for sulfatase activity
MKRRVILLLPLLAALFLCFACDWGNGTPKPGEDPEETPKSVEEGFVYVLRKTVQGSDAYGFTVTVPDNPDYNDPGKVHQKKGVFVRDRTLTVNGFAMAKYETTQDLWYTVQTWALEQGYQFQHKKNKAPEGDSKDLPVTGISWRDAVVWCNAYSEMNGKTPVYTAEGAVIRDSRNANGAVCDGASMDKTKSGYRLPTEVEREFAARGGDPARADWMFTYAGGDDAEEVAWHYGNSPRETRTVGTKQPNRLGIYDLSGNVQEWAWDWMNYAVDLSPATPIDGAAYSASAPMANQKPFNGGGVGSNPTMSCVADRWGYGPTYTDNFVGFRVVYNP